MTLLLSTYAVIFLAELPDKTAVGTLVLATRYRARDVVAGCWLAFLVQTVVACAAGGLLSLLPERPIRVAAGVGFLVFAVLAWRHDEAEEELEEERAVGEEVRRRRPAWLSSFLVIFAAEWGDLTQLATAALVARTGEPLLVGLGALAALCTVTVIAVAAGSAVGRLLRPTVLARVSAGVFAVIGGVVITGAVRG